MPEHDGVPPEDSTAPPVPQPDPAASGAGNPGSTEFVDEMRTQAEADMARASLAALRGWAARRERLSADRADLMAAAWWSGHRNVAELARSADVSRDTAYADLRARGVEPTDKTTTVDPSPRYVPLTAEKMGELAALSRSAVLPALRTEEPAPLAETAWSLCQALERIADLLNPDSENMLRWGRDELAHDLAARLNTALRRAQRVAAAGVSDRQLAGRALNRIETELADERYAVESATVRLFHLHGEDIDVRIGQAQFSDFAPAGWTLLDTDRPLREPTGAEHLAIRAALDTIAEALNGPLTDESPQTEASSFISTSSETATESSP